MCRFMSHVLISPCLWSNQLMTCQKNVFSSVYKQTKDLKTTVSCSAACQTLCLWKVEHPRGIKHRNTLALLVFESLASVSLHQVITKQEQWSITVRSSPLNTSQPLCSPRCLSCSVVVSETVRKSRCLNVRRSHSDQKTQKCSFSLLIQEQTHHTHLSLNFNFSFQFQ